MTIRCSTTSLKLMCRLVTDEGDSEVTLDDELRVAMESDSVWACEVDVSEEARRASLLAFWALIMAPARFSKEFVDNECCNMDCDIVLRLRMDFFPVTELATDMLGDGAS